jgi:hypothetical protein
MTVRRIVSIYLLLFALSALADLGSTLLGHAAGAVEFNPAVGGGGQIDVARFAALNLVAAALIGGMLGWGLTRRAVVDPRYMQAPLAGALTWLTYLNPFSDRNAPRAVFHWVAIAISLLLVRLAAVLNNLLITSGLPDAITPLARLAALQPSEALVYPLAATAFIAPFWVISLYLVPRLLALPDRRGAAIEAARPT